MTRYTLLQSVDFTANKELKDAQRILDDIRISLTATPNDESARSLRLATQIAPDSQKLRAILSTIQLRESNEDPLPERSHAAAAVRDHLSDALALLPTLERQRQDLLFLLEQPAPHTDDTQLALGAVLVTLDALSLHVGSLSSLMRQRADATTAHIRQTQQRATWLTAALAALTVVAFVVAIGTIWFAIAPIQRLTNAASKVGRGDFDIERVRAGNDEVGQLAEAFHKMTEGLASRDHALLAANRELEDAYTRLLSEEKARIEAERLAVVGELSARITHELRNPLSSLSLNFEMVMEDPAVDALEPDTREMLASMEREIGRLESLASAYLTLARPTSGERQRVDVAALLHHVAQQYRRTLEHDGITLDVDVPPSVVVEGDSNELQQVVINLMENARSALEAAAGPRCVRMHVVTHADRIALYVEDTGPGVDPTFRDALFLPFRTQRQGGTGLGLSTSRGIAEAHGGTLRYEPSPDGGAAFILELPRVHPTPPASIERV